MLAGGIPSRFCSLGGFLRIFAYGIGSPVGAKKVCTFGEVGLVSFFIEGPSLTLSASPAPSKEISIEFQKPLGLLLNGFTFKIVGERRIEVDNRFHTGW